MKNTFAVICASLVFCGLAMAQNEPERFARRDVFHPPSCSTQGYNLVDNTSCVATASASIIDASVFAGTDMCAKIAAAIATLTLPASATIDARGITGSQTCATNPFGATGVIGRLSGELLLGGVSVATDQQWTVPNHFWIRGLGLASASSGSNSIIQVSSSFSSTCTGGTTMKIPSGTGTTYCPAVFIGSPGSDIFAAGITHLTVDCNDNSACIGVGSANVQEGGGLDQVAFIHQTISCVDFDSSAKTGGVGISNSFIRNVNCTFPSTDSALSSAYGILIYASDGPAEVSNVTVSVPGGGAGNITTACVDLNGAVGAQVNYLHCEHSANALILGDSNASGDITVHGLTTSATITHAGVWIKNATNVTVEGLFYGGGGGTAIIDGTNSINLVETNEALYAMSTAGGPILTTSAKTPWVLGSEALGSLSATAPNGSVTYCSNCNSPSNPCTSGGNGALALRQNAAWVCK